MLPPLFERIEPPRSEIKVAGKPTRPPKLRLSDERPPPEPDEPEGVAGLAIATGPGTPGDGCRPVAIGGKLPLPSPSGALAGGCSAGTGRPPWGLASGPAAAGGWLATALVVNRPAGLGAGVQPINSPSAPSISPWRRRRFAARGAGSPAFMKEPATCATPAVGRSTVPGFSTRCPDPAHADPA